MTCPSPPTLWTGRHNGPRARPVRSPRSSCVARFWEPPWTVPAPPRTNTSTRPWTSCSLPARRSRAGCSARQRRMRT
ncbi:hypothetical protein ACFFX0_27885 [Citricoccus parietis]|uniref:Uncharacterized protein n=1 Tax=Citricoccus parietis TaxID=592307 RepID=A0ABV5G780_9MICC